MDNYTGERVKIFRELSCIALEDRINDFIAGKTVYNIEMIPLQTTDTKGLKRYEYCALIRYEVYENTEMDMYFKGE